MSSACLAIGDVVVVLDRPAENLIGFERVEPLLRGALGEDLVQLFAQCGPVAVKHFGGGEARIVDQAFGVENAAEARPLVGHDATQAEVSVGGFEGGPSPTSDQGVSASGAANGLAGNHRDGGALKSAHPPAGTKEHRALVRTRPDKQAPHQNPVPDRPQDLETLCPFPRVDERPGHPQVLRAGALRPGEGPPQRIRLRRTHAGHVHDQLDHLFLPDDDAVGARDGARLQRVVVAPGGAVPVAGDELGRAIWSWAGDCRRKTPLARPALIRS